MKKKQENILWLLLSMAILLIASGCEKEFSDLGKKDNNNFEITADSIFPGVERVSFFSNELGIVKSFVVTLPEGYSNGDDNWPVVYIYHGKGRSENSLVEIDTVRSYLLSCPFIIVMPDGDNGWYIDSPVDSKSRYESYLREVMNAAETKYRISDIMVDRGIIGWSMGGYGAVRFAETYRKEFGSVISILGVIDYPSTGMGREVSENDESKIFGDQTQVWTSLNPINYAARLRNKNIYLITCSNDSMTILMNTNFKNKLLSLNIDHQFTVLQGGHDFDIVVGEAMPLALEKMKSWLDH